MKKALFISIFTGAALSIIYLIALSFNGKFDRNAIDDIVQPGKHIETITVHSLDGDRKVELPKDSVGAGCVISNVVDTVWINNKH